MCGPQPGDEPRGSSGSLAMLAARGARATASKISCARAPLTHGRYGSGPARNESQLTALGPRIAASALLGGQVEPSLS